MDWLHWKTIDWAATGTMLQGIGAIIGALAVIVAAAIGNKTLRAWRRQQLVQKHMELAERILTLAIRAKQEIKFVRSPLKTAAELARAAQNLEANGFHKASYSAKWHQLCVAQTTIDRIEMYKTTWADLQEIKPVAFIYFGSKTVDSIDVIINSVLLIQIDAQAYAEDNFLDPNFTKKLRETMSFSRSAGNHDELGDKVDKAVEAIREQLHPLLQDVATANSKAVKQFIIEVAKRSDLFGVPFEISRIFDLIFSHVSAKNKR